MRAVRWLLLGVAALSAGAALGFTVSLVRPRHYADVTAVHPRPSGSSMSRSRTPSPG